MKYVYEADPLKCPMRGGVMKGISFIDEDLIIEKILRHCGPWKEPPIRQPPTAPPPVLREHSLVYRFFEST
jgi:hypothetical protein